MTPHNVPTPVPISSSLSGTTKHAHLPKLALVRGLVGVLLLVLAGVLAIGRGLVLNLARSHLVLAVAVAAVVVRAITAIFRHLPQLADGRRTLQIVA